MKSSNVIAIALAALGLIGAQVSSAGEKWYPYVATINVGDHHPNLLKIHVPGNFDRWVHDGCSTPWYVVSKYPLSDERTKAWLAIALESFRLKKPVHVSTAGCTGGPGIGYPVLINLQIQQP